MTKKTEDHEGVNVPLDFHIPKDIISRYATNMTIQPGENEFIISFFEVIPPMLLGTPEERARKIKSLKEVRAECVARVIVAADKLPSFIEAMQTNLGIYQSRGSMTQDKDD